MYRREVIYVSKNLLIILFLLTVLDLKLELIAREKCKCNRNVIVLRRVYQMSAAQRVLRDLCNSLFGVFIN
jgi:hypothetical protein